MQNACNPTVSPSVEDEEIEPLHVPLDVPAVNTPVADEHHDEHDHGQLVQQQHGCLSSPVFGEVGVATTTIANSIVIGWRPPPTFYSEGTNQKQCFQPPDQNNTR